MIGPGLGTDAHARGLVREVLAAGVPTVLDADALNVMAQTPAELAAAAGALVLTPPRRAARDCSARPRSRSRQIGSPQPAPSRPSRERSSC